MFRPVDHLLRTGVKPDTTYSTSQQRGRNWPGTALKLSLNLMVTSSIVLGTASIPRVYGKCRSVAACHPSERNSLLWLVYWYNEYA